MITSLTDLQQLTLKAPVSDEGLRHLSGLNKLQLVGITSPNVLAAGLGHLPASVRMLTVGSASDLSIQAVAQLLPQRARLSVAGPGVTDAGLRHVAGMDQLGALELHGTPVTATGLEELFDTNLTSLTLSGESITDETIAPLVDLDSLTELRLIETNVTDAGLAKLRAANRRLQIRTR